MHNITCRLHRVDARTIDVDFQLTPSLIITVQFPNHSDAAECQRQFNEAAPNGDAFVRDLLRERTGYLIDEGSPL